MYKKILSYFISGMMLLVFVMPFLVQAQETSNPNPGTSNPSVGPSLGHIEIANPFQQNTIEGLINTILNQILIPIGGVVAVLMIMYAGFLFVTARGNEKKIGDAKQALLYACIGAAILLGAKVISDAISATITQLKV